jgi:hypothetical protein
MSINGHSEWYKNAFSLPFSSLRVGGESQSRSPLFTFLQFFAYELWIENWSCDFSLRCPFIIASFAVGCSAAARFASLSRYDCFEHIEGLL